MSTFLLQYQLLNAGWAEFRIHIEHEHYECAVSYLFDSLSDLSLKTLHLFQSEKYDGFVSFADEPGEFQLSMVRVSHSYVQLKGTWFDEWTGWEDVESPRAKKVFFCEVPVLDFARQVLNNLDKIFTNYGMNGYKEKWKMHDFPYDNYMKLKKALNGNKHKK